LVLDTILAFDTLFPATVAKVLFPNVYDQLLAGTIKPFWHDKEGVVQAMLVLVAVGNSHPPSLTDGGERDPRATNALERAFDLNLKRLDGELHALRRHS
jgi:hypothetical protein